MYNKTKRKKFMNNKKPISFLILKIVAVLGVAVLVFAFVMLFTGFGDFESNNFMIGMFLLPVGIGATVAGILVGFGPEIAKMKARNSKYIQQEIKGDLTDIVNTNAEINSGAITTTTQAVKKGLSDNKFCKYCGAEIDADSIFCNKCGKEQ